MEQETLAHGNPDQGQMDRQGDTTDGNKRSHFSPISTRSLEKDKHRRSTTVCQAMGELRTGVAAGANGCNC